MSMRPDVASGLQRVQHSLERLGIVSMQNEDLAFSRVGPRLEALCLNDVAIHCERCGVPGKSLPNSIGVRLWVSWCVDAGRRLLRRIAAARQRRRCFRWNSMMSRLLVSVGESK